MPIIIDDVIADVSSPTSSSSTREETPSQNETEQTQQVKHEILQAIERSHLRALRLKAD